MKYGTFRYDTVVVESGPYINGFTELLTRRPHATAVHLYNMHLYSIIHERVERW